MHIVFAQNIWREYFGVMSLAAALKRAGHTVQVCVATKPEGVFKAVLEHNPDLLGFSFTNCEAGFAQNSAALVKEMLPDLPIIFGGVHATLNPDLLQYSDADFLCVGEGDEAIVELADALERKQSPTAIPNIWAKAGGEIFPNNPRGLIQNLDALPYPDREVYYRYRFLRSNPVKFFFTGRGCPYRCRFCFNSKLRDLYKGGGKYVRRFSVDWCIGELDEVIGRYPTRVIRFEDDVFSTHWQWLDAFLGHYRDRGSLPFLCYIKAGENEKVIELLARSGCYCALFGVESGDEQTRRNLLGKPVTDDQIFETAGLLKKYGIHLFTSNMIGLPGETFDQAMQTVSINRKIGATDVWCSVFQPYEGLDITADAHKDGFLPAAIDCQIGSNTFSENVLMQPDIERLFNLHKFFYPMVRWPFLEPLILRLIRLRPNKFFHYIFLFFYVVSFLQHSKAGIGRTIYEGFHWFRVFLAETGSLRKTDPD